MKIALISCSKKKKNYSCAAHQLYSESNLFLLSYRYAKKYADKVYILSAKYGLVSEERVLAPYNQTLKKMSRKQQLQWADTVLNNMKQEFDIQNNHFIFLAGKTYCRDLLQHLPDFSLPLDGMTVGERMAYLKEFLDGHEQSMCTRLHRIFGNMPRYTWDQINDIPFTNGIYIIFEKGEQYQGGDRIVRVGTHTAQNRLKQRLSDHFVKENHDGSIFRKNIGKAILNERNDPYLKIWSLDTSKTKNRELLDENKNKSIEQLVSNLLHNNFSFTVFQVEKKEERLRLEEAIISTLNKDHSFAPSTNWLGKFCPDKEIKESGMWLKQGLNAAEMTETEFCRLVDLCNNQTIESNAFGIQHNAESPKNIEKTVFKNDCGKYEPLYSFLKQQTDSVIIISLSEIESILNFKLPKSAKIYTAWWNPQGHPHCNAWINAGYFVSNTAEIIKTGIIRFEKYKT